MWYRVAMDRRVAYLGIPNDPLLTLFPKKTLSALIEIFDHYQHEVLYFIYLRLFMTGLDPALPLFATADTTRKIDPSDAKLVDITHTNALQKGKLERSGNVDFFANGGMLQPGCKADENYSKYRLIVTLVALYKIISLREAIMQAK